MAGHTRWPPRAPTASRPPVPARVRRGCRPVPGHASAPRGRPRGRRPPRGARRRWAAPSRVSHPSVRGCAPGAQSVPQKSRYPQYVSRERIFRVPKGSSRATGVACAPGGAPLIPLVHVPAAPR
ncbi:Exonuclease SbcC [Streptomyces murinus]